MKKHLLIILVLALFSQLAIAQAPAQFNYQGAARSSSGQPIAGRQISLRISILDGSENGAAQYRESRRVMTNAFGLYSVQIGSSGAGSITGSVASVSWGKGPKFIKVEIDPQGGINYAPAGTAQLLSVPYALYAGNAESGEKGEKGDKGKSAYELWLEQGNTGTIIDYLNSLKGKDGSSQPGEKGDKGDIGSTGKSAYELWLEQGNTGTLIEYLNSLKGPKGATGAQGPAGLANGPAGGDLTGNYPDPLVNGLQGKPLQTIGVKENQVLMFNGTKWIASTLNDEAVSSAKKITSAELDITGGDGAVLKEVSVAIKAGAVSTVKLANEAVTESKIKSGGKDKILGTDSSGTVEWQDRSSASSSEPWYDQQTQKGASGNTQNIYQMGSVGIYTKATIAPLDVRGAVRFGQPQVDAPVGAGSLASGNLTTASGTNASAFGQNNKATALNATVFGQENTVSGTHSTAFGTNNIASGSRSTVFGTLSEVIGNYSTSFGSTNKITGYMSTTMGGNLVASGNYQFLAGTNNAMTTGDETIMQVGNGDPNHPTQRSNVLTILKTGDTGIGQHTVAPNSTLQVFGSVSSPIRTMSGGVVADRDFTILVKGNLNLPPAAPNNIGRIYHLINDQLMDAQLNGNFRIAGLKVTMITLSGTPGSRGYTVQSDGTDWVVIGQL
ncbi:hypothetical protein [Pedobacter frigoris]|uniref:hypothetical protein n=1 Tax=Pedobacter frigoris TaxID=2571272 RepID=UPI0029319503|nr:hypothetical protein [Pedobacter frigoris]